MSGVVWALALAAATSPAATVPGAGGTNGTLSVAGHSEVVFDWSRDACEPEHYPDLPVRAFHDARGLVHLVLPNYETRAMVGTSLDRLDVRCDVLLGSDDDPRPWRFDDREWLASPYTEDGRTVYALVHSEYQGYRRPQRCPSRVYQRCWYNALTLAVANDGGRVFRHAPPPRHLVAAPSVRYAERADAVGVFRPSNIVKRNGYYYALALAKRSGSPRSGVCVLRTPTLAKPDAWRAWDGENFTVKLGSPYAGSTRRCAFASSNEISEMSESLTWNTYLGRWVLVGMAGNYNASRGEIVWGIYYSFSSDLVNWTPRRLVLETGVRAQYRCGDEDPTSYPSLIDPTSKSRNFETTGRHPYLYAVRIHYRDCRQTNDRDLLRMPVDVSR